MLFFVKISCLFHPDAFVTYRTHGQAIKENITFDQPLYFNRGRGRRLSEKLRL